MLWLWLVFLAYILNTLATLISKWLLLKEVPHPVVFTFYIGALNLMALVLIPFGFYYPGITQVLVALGSGACFGIGLYLINKAMQTDQVSQVAPMVGGLQPIFVIAFAWWFLPEELVVKQYLGIGLLVIGSVLIALEIGRKRIFTESIGLVLGSSLFFGISFASLKLVYLQQEFISGFVWTRIGMFLFVIILVLVTKKWRMVWDDFHGSGQKVKGWFVLAQIFGALSFVLIAYAISQGPVTIINALQGIQYAFLFILIVILMKKYPQLLDEPMTRSVLIHKAIATIIIILGLALVI